MSSSGEPCTPECKTDPCSCGDDCRSRYGCRCETCNKPCKCSDGVCLCGKGCTGPNTCKCDNKCSCK